MAEIIEDVYPLTPVQQALLAAHGQRPRAGVGAEQVLVSFTGALNPHVFAQAWQYVADRHPALRTAFGRGADGRARQVVHRGARFPLEVLDWRATGEKVQDARLQERLDRERPQGFALGRAPLMRATLIRRGARQWTFAWRLSHLVADGRSCAVALGEFAESYRALLQGRTPRLAPAPPYRDYLTWWAAHCPRKDAAFWAGELGGFTAPAPLLWGGAPALPAHGATHEVVTCPLEGPGRGAAQVLRAHRLTRETLVLGAWLVLLSRYHGRADVLCGATLAHRPAQLPGARAVLGPMTLTLPVRERVEGARTAVSWLCEVQARVAAAAEHPGVPWAQVHRAAGTGPLLESGVCFPGAHLPQTDLAEAGLTQTAAACDTHPRHPLTVLIMPGEAPVVRIVHDRTRISPAAATRIARQLRDVWSHLTSHPELPLDHLTLSAPPVSAPPPVVRGAAQTLTAGFARWVARTPQATAVTDEHTRLTYARLDELAMRTAAALRARGVGPGSRVALLLEPSAHRIAALIGILKTGAAYVPLDPGHPPAHLTTLLTTARTTALVTTPQTRPHLPAAWTPLTLLLDETGTPLPHPWTSPDTPPSASPPGAEDLPKAKDLPRPGDLPGAEGLPGAGELPGAGPGDLPTVGAEPVAGAATVAAAPPGIAVGSVAPVPVGAKRATAMRTAGAAGVEGATGAGGTQDTQGAADAAGTENAAGAGDTDGATDAAGTEEGTAGTRGTPGGKGPAGAGSTAGPEGAAGVMGTADTQGTADTEDAAGIAGTADTAGDAGAAGVGGSAGTAGTESSTGTADTAGTADATGTASSAATTGTTGTEGSAGTAGTAGAGGTTDTTRTADAADTTVTADAADAADAACVLYTSGSTGPAKAVVLTHANVQSMVAAARREFGFGPQETWALTPSPAFGAGVWEIWNALTNGASLTVVPPQAARTAHTLRRFTAARHVTVLSLTPAAFAQLAQDLPQDRTAPLPDLRHIFLGGGRLDPAAVHHWIEHHGDARPALHHLYGLAEATAVSTHHRITAANTPRTGPLPIGKPLANQTVRVLDRRQRPVPAGVAGELHLAGPAIAAGHHPRHPQPATGCSPTPAFPPDLPICRTGDLVRLRDDGALELLGRLDPHPHPDTPHTDPDNTPIPHPRTPHEHSPTNTTEHTTHTTTHDALHDTTHNNSDGTSRSSGGSSNGGSTDSNNNSNSGGSGSSNNSKGNDNSHHSGSGRGHGDGRGGSKATNADTVRGDSNATDNDSGPKRGNASDDDRGRRGGNTGNDGSTKDGSVPQPAAYPTSRAGEAPTDPHHPRTTNRPPAHTPPATPNPVPPPPPPRSTTPQHTTPPGLPPAGRRPTPPDEAPGKAPRTPTEQQITAYLEQLLETRQIGPHQPAAPDPHTPHTPHLIIWPEHPLDPTPTPREPHPTPTTPALTPATTPHETT
ncbi:AMP-binding protein [Streptomyces sp. x-80]|uniref:AMP-binding protein n=1 Tax=Streptomyces sp. x-80 TaxID=2789282 RepID=UPI00398019DA